MQNKYNTKPKEQILEFLKNHKNKRFTVNEMYESIRLENNNMNLYTIYRNINS